MKLLDGTQIPNHPYPELQEVHNIFVDEITAELKENLVGIYLVGSIASGDFDLDSDVDFLVVTNTELTEADMTPLQDIQTKIHNISRSRKCKTRLILEHFGDAPQTFNGMPEQERQTAQG